jgi:hypothetical protein
MGSHDKGQAIARGAHAGGHAISTGAHAVTNAVERGARRIHHAFVSPSPHNGSGGGTNKAPAPPKTGAMAQKLVSIDRWWSVPHKALAVHAPQIVGQRG